MNLVKSVWKNMWTQWYMKLYLYVMPKGFKLETAVILNVSCTVSMKQMWTQWYLKLYLNVMPEGFKLETAVILNESVWNRCEHSKTWSCISNAWWFQIGDCCHFEWIWFWKREKKLYEVHVSTILTKPCQILDLKWLTKLCKVPVWKWNRSKLRSVL